MIRKPSLYELILCPSGERIENEPKIEEENTDPKEIHRKTVERENIIKLGDPLFQRID